MTKGLDRLGFFEFLPFLRLLAHVSFLDESWQHVLEPLSAYLQMARCLSDSEVHHGKAFNFGPDATQVKTVLELLDALEQHWETGIENPVRIDEGQSFHEAGSLKLNCDRALTELDWRPVLTFEECAKFTSDWYKNFYQGEDPVAVTSQQIDDYQNLASGRNLEWAR